MNVYESLKAALKAANTIRIDDETYHIDCYDDSDDTVCLSCYDGDECTLTLDEVQEAVDRGVVQMWELVPLDFTR